MTHRLATEKDFEEVYELYMHEQSNPYLTYDPMDIGLFSPIFTNLLKKGTLSVVEEDDRVIATYQLIPKSDRQAHTMYLGGFTIHPSLQGKGYGTTILDSIKNNLFSNGFSRLELTVDVNNVPAIALYKKIGFEIEGRIRNSYRLSTTEEFYDEYLMGLIR